LKRKMENTNRNKSRNMTDFLRYRKDNMPGEERNSFERDLQKDPFAQDASEGFSLITWEEAEKDLSGLKKKLNKRIMKRTPHIYYRLAAAASLLVLVSISVVIYNSQFNKKEMTLGKNDIEVAESPLTVTATEPLKDNTENSETRITSPPLPLSPSPSPAPAPSSSPATTAAIAEAKEKDTFHDGAEKKSEAARLAGVSLQMQAQTPLAARSKAASSYVPPQPLKGLDSFNLWIEKNIRDPLPDNENEEVVVVSFKVRADSTITDFQIITSPGEAYSIEAERLIKEGPVWKPASENGIPAEAETSVKIGFR
jgi:hypothetical protein